MLYLKEDTDAEIVIGPFVDSADGVTAETALTIAAADIRLKKNDLDWAAATNAATHEENGWYRVTLAGASDINSPGRLVLAVHEAGALPVWHEFMVLPATVYDALVAATGNGVNANVMSWNSTAVATPSVAGVPEVDLVLVEGSDATTYLETLDNAVLAAIAALNNLSAAQVNAEVVDVMSVDVWAMLGQAAPPATPTLVQAVLLLYKALRNKSDQSATDFQLYADDGTTVDQKATVGDSGTVFTRGEIGAGP